MSKYNNKYWITELCDSAIATIKEICITRLIEDGYCKYEIERYIEDVENEKISNLEEIVGTNKLIELSYC